MHTALWLLMGLQLRGWVRFLRRSLGTLKGAVLVLLGGVVFAPWLLTLVVATPVQSRADPAEVLRFGPPALLGLTLLSAVFAFTQQRAISFSPAEVNLLFPGPFTRRQLLAYKITISLGMNLLATPIVALTVRYHAHHFLAAYVGLVLALMFQQFFATALALLASAVGASVYNRSRKALLLGLILAAVVAGFWAGREALDLGPQVVLEQIEGSPLWYLLLTPFRWFVQAFLAKQLWPDLALWAGLGLSVNVLLLLLIFVLDARYLEAAAVSSERTYAQLQRMRAGGMLAGALTGSGQPRFSLPSLPWLGGVGPMLWRQLLTAQRGFGPLVLLLLFYAIVLAPILATGDPPQHDLGRALILAGTLTGVTLFMTTMIAYDFRGDLDRIDVLKMLPIAPARLVLGQLAAPVLLVGTLQLFVLTIAETALGKFDPLVLLLVALLVYPFNFVVFGVENLLFLCYPTRILPATPGDFQLMGRHIVLMIAKMLGVTTALLPALGLALLTALLAVLLNQAEYTVVLAALAGAWLGLVAAGVGLVLLVIVAFKRFDVARDTPP